MRPRKGRKNQQAVAAASQLQCVSCGGAVKRWTVPHRLRLQKADTGASQRQSHKTPHQARSTAQTCQALCPDQHLAWMCPGHHFETKAQALVAHPCIQRSSKKGATHAKTKCSGACVGTATAAPTLLAASHPSTNPCSKTRTCPSQHLCWGKACCGITYPDASYRQEQQSTPAVRTGCCSDG
jgi:hypothetical protein